MARSEQFLKRMLSDIASFEPQPDSSWSDVSPVKTATPADIFAEAEQLIEEHGVILRRDEGDPSAQRYVHPIILRNWSNTQISLREGNDNSGTKHFTFVALQYKGDILVSEQDLVAYTLTMGNRANGEQADSELNASAAHLLKEMHLFLNSERDFDAILRRAAIEAGVA